MSSLECSLTKLNAEKELREWVAQTIDLNDIEEDDGSDGNQGKPISYETTSEKIEEEAKEANKAEDKLWEKVLQELREGEQFDPEGKFHPDDTEDKMDGIETTDDEDVVKPMVITNNPCMEAFPSQSVIPGFGDVPLRRDPVVVLIRHGKTEHNKLGLFTGK